MTDRFKPPSQKVSTPVILVDPDTGEAYNSGNPIPVASEPPVGGATEAEQQAQTAILTALRKSEDAAHASGDAGIPAIAVRQDTLSSLVDTDGDYANLKVDALGRLWSTGTWLEDSVHASGAAGHFVLAIRNDAGTALAGDGDYIGLTVDARGHLWVAGSQVEDAAHTSGDRGIYALAVRADTAAASGANGDYVSFIVDATGKLWVTGTYLTDAAAGASDQVIAVGAIRDDALTALTPVDGDYDRLRVDKWGRLHVRESLDEYETVAASQTTQSLGATGAAGDILSHVIIIPATTSPGAVSIKDGANSAITIFAGGAASVQTLIPFTVPLGLRSTNGAWQITTGADVSAIGVGDFT